jgi:hypothetical protein
MSGQDRPIPHVRATSANPPIASDFADIAPVTALSLYETVDFLAFLAADHVEARALVVGE